MELSQLNYIGNIISRCIVESVNSFELRTLKALANEDPEGKVSFLKRTVFERKQKLLKSQWLGEVWIAEGFPDNEQLINIALRYLENLQLHFEATKLEAALWDFFAEYCLLKNLNDIIQCELKKSDNIVWGLNVDLPKHKVIEIHNRLINLSLIQSDIDSFINLFSDKQLSDENYKKIVWLKENTRGKHTGKPHTGMITLFFSKLKDKNSKIRITGESLSNYITNKNGSPVETRNLSEQKDKDELWYMEIEEVFNGIL